MTPTDEPTLTEYAKAVILIAGCAASIAVGFALIAAIRAAQRLNPLAKKTLTDR
jgi:hypothetical protein